MNKEKCECKGKSTSTIETSNYFRRKQLIYTFFKGLIIFIIKLTTTNTNAIELKQINGLLLEPGQYELLALTEYDVAAILIAGVIK